MSSDAIIKVLDKHGVHISNCSKKRAYQLLGREAADWSGYNVIKLRYDRQDKKRFRQEAMERDNYTCYICGEVMSKDDPRATADHIIAKADGGNDTSENLACCCSECNEEKGSLGLAKFLQIKLRRANAQVVKPLQRRNQLG